MFRRNDEHRQRGVFDGMHLLPEKLREIVGGRLGGDLLPRGIWPDRRGDLCGFLQRGGFPAGRVRLVFSIVVFVSVFGIFDFIGLEAFLENFKVCGVALPLLVWAYCIGLAALVPKAPPTVLSHYWVYENEAGDLVALQADNGRWAARVGREVEPYKFDNILPSESA